MSSDWVQRKLGEFIELKRGYDLPQAKRNKGRIPLVSSAGISDSISVAMVKGPGVVTGRYGTIGQVFYIESDFWPLNTTLYVHDFKGNDPKFVQYFLKTFDFYAYTDKAAVPGINRRSFGFNANFLKSASYSCVLRETRRPHHPSPRNQRHP